MIGTAFPALDLTDYEKTKVSYYATADKPGVLNRIYRKSLYNLANPAQNIPNVKLSEQIQISRRSRIYGMTFTGNIDRWRIRLSNASGTSYTLKTPRSALDPVVSSMIGGSSTGTGASTAISPINFTTPQPSDSIGPNINFNPFIVTTFQAFPFIIEPNWLLMPNETFILEGTPINIPIIGVEGETFIPQLILNVALYVWEFPGKDWF